jgi:hypothetical protein
LRNMSFAHTARQFREGTKTVTRRLGWRFLKPGDLFCAVLKARGVRRDEMQRLGVGRVLSVREERLDAIDKADVVREGYRDLTPEEFVAMFCRLNKHKRCRPETVVTRIEFQRVQEPA